VVGEFFSWVLNDSKIWEWRLWRATLLMSEDSNLKWKDKLAFRDLV
jgi:hypothetical protein